MNENLPNVFLRAIEPEDLDILYSIENDMSLWNVGTTSVPYSRYNLYEYVANAKNDIYSDRQVRMMIENEEKTLVGIVDIINFDPKHLRAEVGIVIRTDFRSKGYAYATIENVKRYACDILHLHQLYAYVNADNQPSLGLFEKCGFQRSCQLRDWLYDGKNYHDAWILQLFL